MKRSLFLFSCLFLLLNVKAQVMWQLNKDSLITWHYQEGDEFNGDAINKNYWTDWFGWARSISSNKEQQYYSKWKNHFVKDGILTLTAKREDLNERYVDWMGDNDTIFNGKKFDGLNKRNFTYSAGLIQSLKDFQYGYFEIKFKIPEEGGFWPAFWLYGATPNEEIDWMELKTEKPNEIHVGRHAQQRKDNYVPVFLGKKVWGDWVKFKGSLNDGYNVISGEWTATSLKYYLNGECIAIANGNMNHPKKLVANIAVSSDNGSFKPGPRNDFKDSVNFEVDYIRVWTRNPTSAQKTNAKNFIIEEKVSGPKEINDSKLISRSKVHYGKPELHKNEGLFASFFPQGNYKYHLTVLGKEIPKDTRIILQDDKGKIILSENLKYGTTVLDLIKYKSSQLNLIIEAYEKKANYSFTVN
jgi:beta-glucanase (GH16 family)